MVIGILMMVFGSLPLAAGAAVVANDFDNSRQQVPNRDFMSVAWHNLRAVEIFPDTFGGDFREAWIRQGIAAESSCASPPLSRELVTAIQDTGCRSVLRATYLDSTDTLVTTIAVVVLGAHQQGRAVLDRFDPSRAGPPVDAYAVPGTPAAGWTDRGRATGAVDSIKPDQYGYPYLFAASVGYLDGRTVDRLPESRTRPTTGPVEEHSLAKPANSMLSLFRQRFHATLTGTDK